MNHQAYHTSWKRALFSELHIVMLIYRVERNEHVFNIIINLRVEL